ncbi:LemA family protein [Capnocytophaga gingivalis]
MNTSIIATVLAVLLAAAVVGFLVTIYNRLVMLRFNTDKAYKNIDVLLKQRADEIPNLVTIAKEFAAHEKKLMTELTELRTAFYNAQHTEEKTQISNEISKGLASFFAVSEQYPTLSSNTHFATLQTRVSQLEDKIADRREFFNDSVNLYNIGIHEFPNLIMAKLLGYKEKTLLQISLSEKQYDGVRF